MLSFLKMMRRLCNGVYPVTVVKETVKTDNNNNK